MAISKIYKSGAELATQILGEGKVEVTRTLPARLENVYQYVDGKRTEKVVAKKLLVMFEGLAADQVKMPADFKIKPADQFYKQIEFIDLTATDYNNQYYFKASGIRMVTKDEA